MPRYLSKSQSYKKTVRHAVINIIQGPHGPVETLSSPEIIARFEQAGVTPYERELAKERFRFLGLAEGEDPIRRVSLYDTEVAARQFNWDAATKAEVEDALDAGQNEFYFRVIDKVAPAPWPSYDKQTPKQIIETATVTGADLESVLVYERENKNRSALIAELEALTVTEPEPLIAA